MFIHIHVVAVIVKIKYNTILLLHVVATTTKMVTSNSKQLVVVLK